MGTVTRNDPFLTRPPRVMALPTSTRRCCERSRNRSVAVFDGESAVTYGILPGPDLSARLVRLRRVMAQLKFGPMLVPRPT